MARLGPSGLAQLFREISTYVSKRLSDYSTKDELDSILDTKADDNNVVHTSGEETINGVKTFTGSPFVSNYATTNGFFTKLNTIARNEVPSQIHHSAFRVFDKNSKTLGEYCVEKSTSGSSLLHMDVHTEDSEGNDIMESVYLNLSNDGSTVSFHPAKNNKTDLGMSHYKWAKIYSDDVVHTSGDENISGNKYFTQDVNVKNSDVDIAVTPSNNLFSCFRFTDKNNANTASLQYSQRPYGVNDICFYVFDADSNSHGFRIRTDNRLEPIENNTYSLGSSSSKWSDVYSTNAYIDRVVCTRFTHSVNNGSVYITGGSEYDKGATLVLHGEESSDAGSFIINSRDKTRSLYLVGKPDGTLQWAGQNIALDGNVVHRSGDETIAGNKTFSNRISFPSGYFISTDPNDNSLRISRSGSDHGNNYKVIIRGDTGKIFAPNGFQGNLQGNANTATSATKASYLDNYSNVGGNKIYLDWDHQVKSYVGLKVDNTTMGGLITTNNLSSQKDNLCSMFANAIRFGGVGSIKLLAFEWDGYNTNAYSLQEGTSFSGANLRHIVVSLSGLSTIPSGSDTIKKYSSGFYLGTRPTGTWSLLSSFGAFNRSYHPEVCIGLFVRIA